MVVDPIANFTQTIITGMNNPECAFFVGQVTGQNEAVRMLAIVLLAAFIFKLVNKAVIDPIIEWVKQKVKK